MSQFEEFSKLAFDHNYLIVSDDKDRFHVMLFQNRERIGRFDSFRAMVEFFELEIEDKSDELINWLDNYWIKALGKPESAVQSHD